MTFLPYEDLVYKSNLPESELRLRISQNIEKKKTYRIGYLTKHTKPYEGYLHGNNFEINRIINYRNSFLPQVKGKIIESNEGTLIYVKMRMHILVYIFLVIWCTGVGYAFISILTVSIIAHKFEPVVFIPLGMLILGFILPTGAFKFESNRTKKDLEKILISEIKK